MPRSRDEPAPFPSTTPDPRPSAEDAPSQERSCRGRPCTFFVDGRAALRALRRQLEPRVLAFGEAHQKTGANGPSAVHYFTTELLPDLAPDANFLLVELLAPPRGCAATETVQEEAHEVTAGQAPANQSEYIELGVVARRLGVVPDVPRANCEQFARIEAAGAERVDTLMELIAELSALRILEELERAPPRRPLVLAYGGALHNDLTPRPGLEGWSYAPRVDATKPASFVEIDLLIDPGLESSPWARLDWFDSVEEAQLQRTGRQAVLIERAPRSFALVVTPPMKENAGHSDGQGDGREAEPH